MGAFNRSGTWVPSAKELHAAYPEAAKVIAEAFTPMTPERLARMEAHTAQLKARLWSHQCECGRRFTNAKAVRMCRHTA